MSSPEKIYRRPKAGKITVVFKSHGAPCIYKVLYYCNCFCNFYFKCTWRLGEFNFTHTWVALCSVNHWEAERKRGDFLLHILHNFLSISSLKALVCRMCRVCFPWTRGSGTRQKRKQRKKTQSWREGGGGKCSSFLSRCNIERWIYYPENLTDFFFPEVPGTQSYHYDQNTWTEQQLPNLTLKEGKKRKWSLLQSAPVFIFVLHHAQLVFMWASWWRSGNRAWKY